MSANNGPGEIVPRLLFLLSLCIVSVGYGMFAWKNNWFPAPTVRTALAEWRHISGPETKRPHKVPNRHDKEPGASLHLSLIHI